MKQLHLLIKLSLIVLFFEFLPPISSFPYLFDASKTVYAEYGARKTPHVYLLQKENGKKIVKYIGAIDDNVRNGDAVKDRFLANAVNELIQGKEVSVKETKAIGCSVKV